MQDRIIIEALEIIFAAEAQEAIREYLPLSEDYQYSFVGAEQQTADFDTLVKYCGRVIAAGTKRIEAIENNEIKAVFIYCPAAIEYRNPYSYLASERDLFLSWAAPIIQKLDESGLAYTYKRAKQVDWRYYDPGFVFSSTSDEDIIMIDFGDSPNPIAYISVHLPLNHNIDYYIERTATQDSPYDIIMLSRQSFRVIDKEFRKAHHKKKERLCSEADSTDMLAPRNCIRNTGSPPD